MFPFGQLNYRFRVVGLILLGGLLVVVAGLQYHWLNQISQAQIEQTRRQLDTAIGGAALSGIIEIVPSYRSLLVCYEPLITSFTPRSPPARM